MRMTRALFVGGAAALLASVAVACGGNGDTPPATGTQSNGGTAVAGRVDGPQLLNGLPSCLPPGTEVSGSPFKANADPLASTPPNQQNTIRLVAAAADVHQGANNLAIGITDLENEPIGDAKVRLTVYDLDKGQAPVCQVEAVSSAPGVREEFVHVHGDGREHVHGGQDADRAVYYANVGFDRAGSWGLAVEAIMKDGKRGTGTLLLQVAEKSTVPAIGEKAPLSDNLTKHDVANISEIDSGDPPNDMHDHKIKDVIAAGRPLVIVFSTPAYCTSAFCGPVNEEVEDLFEDYKERVDFIHIEIWRDRLANPPVLNPTAKEWLLRPDGGLAEPIVYVIDKNGVIYDRWEGPVARNIMETSIKAVAEGAVFQP
jgi:hypothetical protein